MWEKQIFREINFRDYIFSRNFHLKLSSSTYWFDEKIRHHLISILLQDPELDQTFFFNTIIKPFWRIFPPNYSFLYRLPYDDIFGGVSAMTVEQFRKVNGFSNMFWGWGGEDDDMSNRLRQKKLYISRYPANIARYRMLKHSKDKANPDRFKYLYSGAKRIDKDGYNSLKYKPVKVELKRLYTWILVELPHLSV